MCLLACFGCDQRRGGFGEGARRPRRGWSVVVVEGRLPMPKGAACAAEIAGGERGGEGRGTVP